jgi:hypothetical protein
MKQSFIITTLIIAALSAFPLPAGASRQRSCKQTTTRTYEKDTYAFVHTKGLEHDEKTGLLTSSGKKRYDQLVKAAMTGDQSTLMAMKAVPGSERNFVYLETLGTYDQPLTAIPPFPTITSKEAAAQLAEVYLLALARDVPFHEYGTGTGLDKDDDGSSITGKAIDILNGYGKAYAGPVNKKGKADTRHLFRGNYHGFEYGPYISQFLYIPLSIPAATLPPSLGFKNIPPSVFQTEQLQPIPAKRNFGITEKEYLSLQNGKIPQPYSQHDFSLEKRYISTGRDLASSVHFESPFPAFYNALNILYAYTYKTPSGKSLRKASFEKMSFLDIIELLCGVTKEVEKAVSAYKWQGQRIVRPEQFANLVNLTKKSVKNIYKLSADLLRGKGTNDLLSWVRKNNLKEGADSYLMPLVYPEGAPLHPSYPSGHATYSGAYITILKAIFDDRALFSDLYSPVKPDPKNPHKLIPITEDKHHLTIGGELNKLASNIGIGRNFAGIHYRADADYGMRLGESVAITFLQKLARSMKDFKGFELITLDGKRMKVPKR